MSEVTFVPYQPVLVRNFNEWKWRAVLFSHKENNVFCASGAFWEQCIPYEGNEHLLGTTNSPTPPKSPFKFGDKVEVRNDIKEDWKQALFLFRETCDYPYNVMLPEINGIKSFKYCRHADW